MPLMSVKLMKHAELFGQFKHRCKATGFFLHLVLIPINTKLLKLKSTLWPFGKKHIGPYPMTKFQIPCRSFVAPRPHSRLPEAARKPISVALCWDQVFGVQGAAWCKMQSKGCACKPPTADSRFSFHQCA